MTQEDVLNIALEILGEPATTGPEDTSSWVRRCRAAFPRATKAIFESYPWNFCEEVVQLTPSDPTPIDWAYGFNKPPHCRRINWVDDHVPPRGWRAHRSEDRYDYKERSGRLLANSETIYLWYIDGIYETKLGLWPQVFGDYVGCQIAEIVYPRTSETDSTRDRIERKLRRAMRKARAHDGQADPPQKLLDGSWVRASQSNFYRNPAYGQGVAASYDRDGGDGPFGQGTSLVPVEPTYESDPDW